LKEPIRTVRSFYQVIRRRINPEVLAKAETAELFKLVEKRSGSMHNMLERLLQYSRFSSREGVKQRLNIQRLISDQVAKLEIGTAVSIYHEPHCEWVCIELDEVHQVFEELLSNAVKFASKVQPLTIDFSAKCVRAGYITCALTDNGIGIREENHEKVIGLFQRLSGCKTHAGTGLGLSIASAIVAKNGGKLWVSSDGHTGTTVHFELPAGEDLKEEIRVVLEA